MGLFDRFPWVNTHDLNLDWIIQKMKEWGADAAANVAKAETAATNAAANAAAAAEPYALRAETAADRAEAAKSSAETAYVSADSAAKSARDFKVNAEASATEASRIEAVVEGYAQDCNNASASAQASATAAAQSAEEAKTATKWPYDGVYNGYLYKRLGSVDQYTRTDMEFLTAPQENEVLYRVSGRIPKRASFNDATTYDYHYEKILKMVGHVDVSTNDINFRDSFALAIPGLVIAEAETIGMVLFRTNNNSFYKYSLLPLVNLDSNGLFTIDSDGFTIPDDMTADITCKLQNESISVSNLAAAYLYVRMKYTF